VNRTNPKSGSPENWENAEKLSNFCYPWETDIAVPTVFYALHDDSTMYCLFEVKDTTLVQSDTLREELDITKEDRVEIYFSKDRNMMEYYCLEVDPQGRILDYRASYYRLFDYSWDISGARSCGTIIPGGYRIEFSIPLNGLPYFKSGQPLSIYVGLFRADLRVDQNKKLAEHWISWIDPNTGKPDFHVPKSLGIFQFK